MKTNSTKLAGKGSYICPTCTIIDLENEGTLMAASGVTDPIDKNPIPFESLYWWEDENF